MLISTSTSSPSIQDEKLEVKLELSDDPETQCTKNEESPPPHASEQDDSESHVVAPPFISSLTPLPIPWPPSTSLAFPFVEVASLFYFLSNLIMSSTPLPEDQPPTRTFSRSLMDRKGAHSGLCGVIVHPRVQRVSHRQVCLKSNRARQL